MIPGLKFIRMDVNEEGKEVGVFEIDHNQIVMVTNCETEEIIFASPEIQARVNKHAAGVIARVKL